MQSRLGPPEQDMLFVAPLHFGQDMKFLTMVFHFRFHDGLQGDYTEISRRICNFTWSGREHDITAQNQHMINPVTGNYYTVDFSFNPVSSLW